MLLCAGRVDHRPRRATHRHRTPLDEVPHAAGSLSDRPDRRPVGAASPRCWRHPNPAAVPATSRCARSSMPRCIGTLAAVAGACCRMRFRPGRRSTPTCASGSTMAPGPAWWSQWTSRPRRRRRSGSQPLTTPRHRVGAVAPGPPRRSGRWIPPGRCNRRTGGAERCSAYGAGACARSAAARGHRGAGRRRLTAARQRSGTCTGSANSNVAPPIAVGGTVEPIQ